MTPQNQAEIVGEFAFLEIGQPPEFKFKRLRQPHLDRLCLFPLARHIGHSLGRFLNRRGWVGAALSALARILAREPSVHCRQQLVARVGMLAARGRHERPIANARFVGGLFDPG